MAFPSAVANAAWDRGLIVRAMWECTGVAPPLCTTLAEADEIVDILVDAVAAVESSA